MEDLSTILSPRFLPHSQSPPSISPFSLLETSYFVLYCWWLIWEFLRHIPILQLLLASEITAWPVVLCTLSVSPSICTISRLSFFNLLFFFHCLRVCSFFYELVVIIPVIFYALHCVFLTLWSFPFLGMLYIFFFSRFCSECSAVSCFLAKELGFEFQKRVDFFKSVFYLFIIIIIILLIYKLGAFSFWVLSNSVGFWEFQLCSAGWLFSWRIVFCCCGIVTELYRP